MSVSTFKDNFVNNMEPSSPPEVNNKYAYAFIAFGIMVFFYVIYSEAILDDPRMNPDDLVKHVVAQKMIVFWILFAVYIYSIGLGKYLFKNNDKSI